MSDNPFKNAQQQLRLAASLLAPMYKDHQAKFEATIQKLMSPQNLFETSLNITLDNGHTQTFKAYRSQHNDARGPYKGGIRFHPQVSVEEVQALSMWMTWKCATTGIPYGGGKGGVIVDPSKLSVGELERLTKAYAKAITPIIGSWKDVPAPDVNTNGQTMAWMLEAYEQEVGHHEPGVFTGKPLEIGGSLGRDEATGKGGVIVLQQLVQKLHLKTQQTQIAVQGLGNVGSWFALLAEELGFVIVALSDSKGAILAEDRTRGLNIKKALEHKKKTGSLKGFGGTTSLSNDELLLLDVDVLVPAALENVISEKNVTKLKAKAIIEMANGPVTPEADVILARQKIFSVPDVLANAGGVTVSYFEWVQNLYGYNWSKEEVFAKLEPLMVDAFDRMWAMHLEKNIDLRMAAYVNAVRRVVDAMLLRGR